VDRVAGAPVIALWAFFGMVVAIALDNNALLLSGERLSDLHPWAPVAMVAAWPLVIIPLIGGFLDSLTMRAVIAGRFRVLRRDVDCVLEDL